MVPVAVTRTGAIALWQVSQDDVRPRNRNAWRFWLSKIITAAKSPLSMLIVVRPPFPTCGSGQETRPGPSFVAYSSIPGGALFPLILFDVRLYCHLHLQACLKGHV
jgi:hypothetical protein